MEKQNKVDQYIPPTPRPAKRQRAVDILLAGIHTLDGFIKYRTEDFERYLNKVEDENERLELQGEMKGYLDRLTNLYRRI